MDFQPNIPSYRSSEFVKQLPLKIIKKPKEPLRQLSSYYNISNSNILHDEDDRWQNSPQINSQNYLLNTHLSLYNKFSATISSFQKAYKKEENKKNQKNKSFRMKESKNRIKISCHKQTAKSSFYLQNENNARNANNYQTYTESHHHQQQEINKQNTQHNTTKVPLEILRKPIKLIPQQTKNYYNTGLNNGKNLIKNVQINFRDIFEQSSLKNSQVNQAFPFSLNKNSCHKSFQNKKDQASKKRVTVTAQYLRKKLAASSKKKLKPNQSENIILSANHNNKKHTLNQYETIKTTNNKKEISSSKKVQSNKENNPPGGVALNNLIFQFLEKEQSQKLKKMDKPQLAKIKVFDSQNILGSSSKQFVRAIKSHKKVI